MGVYGGVLSFSNKHLIYSSIMKDVVPERDSLDFWMKHDLRIISNITGNVKLDSVSSSRLSDWTQITLSLPTWPLSESAYWHIFLFKWNDIKELARKCQYYFTYRNLLIHYFFFYLFCYYKKYKLTHLFPMHPLSAPWKHQETLRFSDVFRG